MASETTRSWPYTRLFYGSPKTVLVTGPHIVVFDSYTGTILRSTARLNEEERKKVLKSGPIHSVAIDQSFRYIAEAGDDKVLKIWDIEEGDESEGLKLLNSRELPKKSTDILFTKDAQSILVSDKFGDVFCYPLVYVPFTSAEIEQQKADEAKDPYASHTNPSNGTLVLGHASPLNAMLLAPSEGKEQHYIVTADRDEHIRVSWFPQGYYVEMYCLGHRKFVSAIHIPASDPSLLVSGGGDPALKVWDWISGQQKGEIDALATVEPFIVVKRLHGRGKGDGEGGEIDEEGNTGPRKGKRTGRKGRGKVASEAVAEDDTPIAVDQEPATETVEPSEATAGLVAKKVMAIGRIESVVDHTGKLHFLFSAIGATALFSVPSPDFSGSLSSPPVSHFDLGKPVVDFVPIPSPTPLVLVVLDCDYQTSSVSLEPPRRVRLLAVSSTGLIEPPTEVSSQHAPLLTALNNHTSTIPASESDLKGFDIYAELGSLPKIATRGPHQQPRHVKKTGEGSGSATPTSGAAVGLTKRELGRLKRTALVEEVKTKVLGSQNDSSGDANQDAVGGQPELKRSKSQPSEGSSSQAKA